MARDADSPIRVVVTPSQSSCFAGETMTIAITFTNTNTAQENNPQVATRTHKRSAHSISAVPLAQPPTSPRSPRTVSPVIATRKLGENDVIERKGLIGRSDSHSRKMRNLSRSLSLDMTFKGNGEVSPEQESSSSLSKMPMYVQRALATMTTPSSPRISSPLARSASLPISSKHPHARKQSVSDGQVSFPHDTSVPSTPSNLSFSLSLDPISESSPGSGPPTSRSVSTPPVSGTVPGFSPLERQADMRVNNLPKRRLPLRSNTADSFGREPPPQVRDSQPFPIQKTASATTTTFNASNGPPNDRETILYSYVQFTGSLAITPATGTTDPLQENALNSLRSSLLKRSIIGGGSMDIAAMLDPSKRRMTPVTRSRPHSRTSSFSSGLISILSAPTSLLGSLSAAPAMTSSVSQQWSPSHRSASSLSLPASRSAPTLSTSSMTTTFNGGFGLQRSPSEELCNPEAPLPTYEVQPALLAVDVSLGPGESRSYTYSLPLPKILPPTFKGRTFRFSYEFSIGVCRAGSSPGNSSANHSRVMKIPVRVYNHVNVMNPPTPYDLLWPVQCARSPHQISKPIIVEGPHPSKNPFQLKLPSRETISGSIGSRSPHSASKAEGSMSSVREYARFLLATSPSPDGDDPDVDGAREREAGGLTGCREAVEILTRNPKKLSFDVNKNGVPVAVLTFTKSAYRLGETVMCIVDVNERLGRSRVLKLSAMLESHEMLPMSLASRSNTRLLRRTHAEHHSSLVSATLRVTFALDIPPDASPAFQIEVQGESGYLEPPISAGGGLEWKVRLCLLVAVASDESRKGQDGVRLKTLVRDGPSGEWGISWRGAPTIAPLEQINDAAIVNSPSGLRSWANYLASPFTGVERYHDGDELDEGDEGEVDEEWSTVKVETVECEVPIKVWPGNTAFNASDVVFNV